MRPLISVIVPVYKVEHYLSRCITSIQNQTYQNLEVILVDDGSPDSCPNICDQYANLDQRIRVIHKDNGGLSDARNVGIKVAQGEFLCFVDSDDYIASTMLEHLYVAIERFNVKLAICNINVVDEMGIRQFEQKESPIFEGVYASEELLPKLYQNLGWYYIVAWNKLYHHSLFAETVFPVGKIHEDEFIVPQIMWNAGKIACISQEEYFYTYQRKGSIMSSKKVHAHCDWLEALYYRFLFSIEIKELADFARETRAVYFREMNNLYFLPELSQHVTKMQKLKIKKMYDKLKGKTISENINWLIFRICPQLDRYLIKLVRKLRGEK